MMMDLGRTGKLTPNKHLAVPSVVNYMAASADDSGLFVATGDGVALGTGIWNGI